MADVTFEINDYVTYYQENNPESPFEGRIIACLDGTAKVLTEDGIYFVATRNKKGVSADWIEHK